MWRRSALARSISCCSNISGVTRTERVTAIRSCSAVLSTWSSNTASAVAILRLLSAVSRPRTPPTAAAVR
jgi:hypothetical protein